MKTKLFFRLLCMVAIGLGACNTTSITTATSTPTLPPTNLPVIDAIKFPKIDRHPAVSNWMRGVLQALPSYNPTSNDAWQVDLRHYDLTQFDLRNSAADLLYADFDTQTKWPSMDKMPSGFDRSNILETGKNPGLGIQQIHARGITGRGVGIAIIDQTLLVDHQEYAKQIQLYEEAEDLRGAWLQPQMHGPAVASIAVGKTVGVAPEADLYYIATSMCSSGAPPSIDFSCLAKSVRRILEINQQLPAEKKIRVISMSIGWSPQSKGYEEITTAVQEAKKTGLFVICSSIEDIYGFKFHGLGRSPLADPDEFQSYEPGIWWNQPFLDGQRTSDRLLVPMDSRTTAGMTGLDEYVFYRQGGWSWSIPYLAGMYALAVQVKPGITPDEFWSLALKTGQMIQLNHQGEKIPFGPILDPVALISELK